MGVVNFLKRHLFDLPSEATTALNIVDESKIIPAVEKIKPSLQTSIENGRTTLFSDLKGKDSEVFHNRIES